MVKRGADTIVLASCITRRSPGDISTRIVRKSKRLLKKVLGIRQPLLTTLTEKDFAAKEK